MKEGDLIHIPQAVKLFNTAQPHIDITEKPILGIFLRKNDDQHSSIFIRGEEVWVETRHIYPIRENYAS